MPDDTQPATPEELDKALALSDLDHIHSLKHSTAFLRYFLREPLAKIAELEKKLRSRTLTNDDRQYLIGQLEVWERVRDKLDTDETGNRSIAGV